MHSFVVTAGKADLRERYHLAALRASSLCVPKSYPLATKAAQTTWKTICLGVRCSISTIFSMKKSNSEAWFSSEKHERRIPVEAPVNTDLSQSLHHLYSSLAVVLQLRRGTPFNHGCVDIFSRDFRQWMRLRMISVIRSSK